MPTLGSLKNPTLIAFTCVVSLSGCSGTPGMLEGARDNTRFAEDDSPHLVIVTDDGGSAEVRTLRGERVRTVVAGVGLGDTDDRGLRIVGRDSVGAFRGVAGESIRRLDLPIEWSFNLTLDGLGSRIAAPNGPRGQLRILSFDTGEILLSVNCPPTASCYWVAWDLEDPNVVWLVGKTHDGYVRLNLEGGETALLLRDANLPIRFPGQSSLWQTTCRDGSAKLVVSRDAIDLAENGQPLRRVVVVEGSSPGWLWFRERSPPIGSAGFIDGCRYVVFSYRSGYYLLELATGSIGRLSGFPLRSLPLAATDR